MNSGVLILLHHGTKQRRWSGTPLRTIQALAGSSLIWPSQPVQHRPATLLLLWGIGINSGRIQHHLDFSIRPNIVQQLFYYSDALLSTLVGSSIISPSRRVQKSSSSSSATLGFGVTPFRKCQGTSHAAFQSNTPATQKCRN